MNIEEIIRQVKQGDCNAFEPVIHAYQQKLFAYCFYLLGNRQEAEDAVQEALIKAYQNLHLYQINQSFLAWLYKIAGNHCLTLLNRRKKWNALLPKFWRQTHEPSAEEAVSKQVEHNFDDLLRGLTAEERQIIILHTIAGYTLDEIAVNFELKAGTVRKRFERIRKKLRSTSTDWEGSNYEQTIRV
ncbi:RNA polymerase sigma factor [Paenibacillus sp. MMS18-CY102]|uniref:RNA polymerase sigma factor n=1 Tax=Paenibacillus sp. MMS18-CY102 TaxID=2682849 RepID=UPI00136599E3|nr:RNA polymerase sigma factor [Paenibacillus sp. MMS18-CY102]MWC29164.1 sigma-70 family RNA polymerase sigma factor [Paenibacillus sp. MMS18-CY102]